MIMSRYCDEPFTVEPVKVIYEKDTIFPDGAEFVYPDLTEKTIKCNIKERCSTIGVELAPAKIVHLLTKMQV